MISHHRLHCNSQNNSKQSWTGFINYTQFKCWSDTNTNLSNRDHSLYEWWSLLLNICDLCMSSIAKYPVFSQTGPPPWVDCMALLSVFHWRWRNSVKCLSQGHNK